jgi:hypothetical protein
MAFMEPEVCEMTMVTVETSHGRESVPLDVCGEASLDALADYIEGEPNSEPEEEEGYWARLSASGYMDATDWIGPYATAEEATKAICELHDIRTECFEACWDGPDGPCAMSQSLCYHCGGEDHNAIECPDSRDYETEDGLGGEDD